MCKKLLALLFVAVMLAPLATAQSPTARPESCQAIHQLYNQTY